MVHVELADAVSTMLVYSVPAVKCIVHLYRVPVLTDVALTSRRLTTSKRKVLLPPDATFVSSPRTDWSVSPGDDLWRIHVRRGP